MSTGGVSPALITGVEHLTAIKYYALAAYVMLVYDVILTLPREVDRIWNKMRFSGLTVIWFCNRWVYLLMVIPTIFGLHDPAFTGKVCNAYFRYPGYVQAFQRTVIGSLFILRTYCLYNRSLKIAALIAVFLAAEIFVKLYTTIKWGVAVQPPPGIVACVLSVSQANSSRFIIYFLMELVVDALVLILTVLRSAQSYFNRKSGSKRQSGITVGGELLKLILRDGVIYFAIMCSANLITVIMYLTAPEDLKAANAGLPVMLNSLLVARLILNLKSNHVKTPSCELQTIQYRSYVSEISRTVGEENEILSSHLSPQPGHWETLVLGEIGNDLETEIGGLYEKTSYSLSSTSTIDAQPDTIGSKPDFTAVQTQMM